MEIRTKTLFFQSVDSCCLSYVQVLVGFFPGHGNFCFGCTNRGKLLFDLAGRRRSSALKAEINGNLFCLSENV